MLRVNSWNEWDPLEAIVVGRADGACFAPTEPGYKGKIRDPELASLIPWPRGHKKQRVIDAANAQLEGLCAILRGEGVEVYRPEPLHFDSPVATPSFEVANMYCCACPRDVMITVGSEILEATMSRRSRFFEYLSYRTIARRCFNADPSVLWTAAPKPSMSDDCYDEDFWSWTMEERHARMHDFDFCITQEEPMFDAADISRMGRDLFVQESMTTNRPGIEWLRRHFAARGIRVTPMHFPYDVFPSHIDCTFVPLRPGLVLTNPERPLLEREVALFSDNGWRFVEAPQPVCSNAQMPVFCQSSKWLSMNVLSLSPTKVVVERSEKPLIRLLRELGFEVLDIPFRDVFEFGGSLHCTTWDLRRVGGCEDYFPKSPAR